MGYNDYYSLISRNVNSTSQDLSVIFVISICAAVCAYFMFLAKKDSEFTGAVKKLHHFLSFKKLIVEDILKAIYLFLAIYTTFLSLYLIKVSFVSFLVVLILGNVLLRVGFELMLVLVLTYRNIKEINEKIKK